MRKLHEDLLPIQFILATVVLVIIVIFTACGSGKDSKDKSKYTDQPEYITRIIVKMPDDSIQEFIAKRAYRYHSYVTFVLEDGTKYFAAYENCVVIQEESS